MTKKYIYYVFWIGQIMEENIRGVPVGPHLNAFDSLKKAREYAKKVRNNSLIDIEIIKGEVVEKIRRFEMKLVENIPEVFIFEEDINVEGSIVDIQKNITKALLKLTKEYIIIEWFVSVKGLRVRCYKK